MAIDVSIIGQPIQMVMESDIWQTLLAISSFAIAVVTAIALSIQIRKQTKVDSARFAMDFLERTGKKYKNILKQIKDKFEKTSTAPYVPREIRLMLNHFEYMALFEADGILSIKHIDEIFGNALLRINNDLEIQEIIKITRKDDETIYSNLINLLEKIKKRHPSSTE